jgi:hypothetical protein
VQARILNADVIERHLLCEFDAVTVPGASYGDERQGRRDTRRIAEWCAGCDVAKREAAMADARKAIEKARNGDG